MGTEKSFLYRKHNHLTCPCMGSFLLINNTVEGSEYVPTGIEELANTVTHFVPAILSIFALVIMFSTVVNTWREIISAYIFIGCCFMLFTISSLYHFSSFLFGFKSKITQIWRKLDYSIIFFFISSSYTPWLLCFDVGINNTIGKVAVVIVWMVALFGVVKHLTNMFPTQNVLVLYLTMGWFSLFYMVLALFHVYSGYTVAKLDIFWSIFWITAGGCIYSAGTLFWKFDGILPFAHAYWHIAVAIAASMHMYAVNKYLMTLE